MDILDGWIVVCTDLHAAAGVVRTEAEAHELAESANRSAREDEVATGQRQCVYEPVPISLDMSRFVTTVMVQAASN